MSNRFSDMFGGSALDSDLEGDDSDDVETTGFGDISDGFGRSALYGGDISDGLGQDALYDDDVNDAAEQAQDSGTDLSRAEISLRSALSDSSPSDVVETTTDDGSSAAQYIPIPMGGGGVPSWVFGAGGAAVAAVLAIAIGGQDDG